MKGVVVLRNRKWKQLVEGEWVESKPPHRFCMKQYNDHLVVMWFGPWMIFLGRKS